MKILKKSSVAVTLLVLSGISNLDARSRVLQGAPAQDDRQLSTQEKGRDQSDDDARKRFSDRDQQSTLEMSLVQKRDEDRKNRGLDRDQKSFVELSLDQQVKNLEEQISSLGKRVNVLEEGAVNAISPRNEVSDSMAPREYIDRQSEDMDRGIERRLSLFSRDEISEDEGRRTPPREDIDRQSQDTDRGIERRLSLFSRDEISEDEDHRTPPREDIDRQSQDTDRGIERRAPREDIGTQNNKNVERNEISKDTSFLLGSENSDDASNEKKRAYLESQEESDKKNQGHEALAAGHSSENERSISEIFE